jgi:hypothetical protein
VRSEGTRATASLVRMMGRFVAPLPSCPPRPLRGGCETPRRGKAVLAIVEGDEYDGVVQWLADALVAAWLRGWHRRMEIEQILDEALAALPCGEQSLTPRTRYSPITTPPNARRPVPVKESGLSGLCPLNWHCVFGYRGTGGARRDQASVCPTPHGSVHPRMEELPNAVLPPWRAVEQAARHQQDRTFVFIDSPL